MDKNKADEKTNTESSSENACLNFENLKVSIKLSIAVTYRL